MLTSQSHILSITTESFKGIKKTDSLLKTAIDNPNKSGDDSKAKSDVKLGDKGKAARLAKLKFETSKQGELYLSVVDQLEKVKVRHRWYVFC
jgi:hypothetical protein